MAVLLINGDARRIPLADSCVHCVVTSPPYWGLRDYNVDGQIGLEDSLEAFVADLVAVFREVWRVLHPSGTVWMNLGDAYATGGYSAHDKGAAGNEDCPAGWSQAGRGQGARKLAGVSGLKQKDLVGIPWRVALALQADGWYLRRDVIWHKPNPMPESATDRPTTAHEYLFLLTKESRYFYDAEAIKEKTGYSPSSETRNSRDSFKRKGSKRGVAHRGQTVGTHREGRDESDWDVTTRNKRSVWTIPTKGWAGAHFATFPTALVEPCVLAGTSEKGDCPVCGSPWVRVVEKGTAVPHPSNQGNPDALPYEAGSGLTNGTNGSTLHKVRSTKTAAWLPTCDCPDHEPVPAVVFDPFVGSGTTLQVARALGRHGVGTDLSFDYLYEQAQARLALDVLDDFVQGNGVKVAFDMKRTKPTPENQLVLL